MNGSFRRPRAVDCVVPDEAARRHFWESSVGAVRWGLGRYGKTSSAKAASRKTNGGVVQCGRRKDGGLEPCWSRRIRSSLHPRFAPTAPLQDALRLRAKGSGLGHGANRSGSAFGDPGWGRRIRALFVFDLLSRHGRAA